MDAKQAIAKIYEMLGLEFSKENTEPVKEEFATTELEDGTRITNDKEGEFELGDKIYVVAEDGTLSPAPAGEHVLRDGFVVVVDEEGTLIEIRVPQSEDVADVVEDNEETEEEMTEEKTELNFEEELGKIKSSIEEMLKLMASQNEEFKAEMSEVKKEVETFKSAPQMKGITEKQPITQSFADMRLEMLKKHIK